MPLVSSRCLITFGSAYATFDLQFHPLRGKEGVEWDFFLVLLVEVYHEVNEWHRVKGYYTAGL